MFDTYQLHVEVLIYDCNIVIEMEIEKSKLLIQSLLIFRQSGGVLLFLYARRPRSYTATVTKKLSKEVSPTESRILGALSKLDEFLLNPQVRTCSVAVPGKFRNSDSGNREPIGDRSRNDPGPGARVSSHHSGNLNSSEVEEYPHSSDPGKSRIAF